MNEDMGVWQVVGQSWLVRSSKQKGLCLAPLGTLPDAIVII